MKTTVFFGATLLAAATAQAGIINPATVVPASALAPHYAEKCAGCHGSNLQGGFGPSLSSADFVAKWRDQPTERLAAYIKSGMPPSDPGSLTASEALAYANMIARVGGFASAPEGASPSSGASPAASFDKESADGGVGATSENKDRYYHAEMERRARKLAALTTVTDQMLAKPDPAEWLSARRTRDGLAFSPLRSIDRKTVSRLSVEWSLALPNGTNGITPIVHDGVMFINSSGTVKALDVSNGDELWSYSREVDVVPLGPPVSQPRSMAIYGDTLYVPTLDNHMIALDVRSGKVRWDHTIERPSTTLRTTAAPAIVRGKIIQGMAGCAGSDETGGCFIAALDAQTGKELWRFYTIPRKGEPGYATWNGAPASDRFGGSIWSDATYDEVTNLIFIGVAQTYHVAPLLASKVTKESKRALYTNATLALNPDTGKLVWFYQHMEREVWDLDWSFERQVYDMQTRSGSRRIVGTIGKLGILDMVDARTGQYVSSFDMGLQDLVTAIDPRTGAKTTRPSAEPEADVAKIICPFAGGVRNWPATSLDPARKMLYVPYTRSCMDYMFRPGMKFDISYGMKPPKDGDGDLGGVMAIDLNTMKPAWTQKQRAPASSGVLATDGGLVFAGDRDRWFRVLNSDTGAVVWQARLDRRLSSNPITFAKDDRQYVAIISGGGAPNDATQESLTPESGNTGAGVTLWVFGLQEPS